MEDFRLEYEASKREIFAVSYIIVVEEEGGTGGGVGTPKLPRDEDEIEGWSSNWRSCVDIQFKRADKAAAEGLLTPPEQIL